MAESITTPDTNEELYRNLIENALQGLAIIQNQKLIFANRALADITGHSLEELLSLSSDGFLSIIYPEDRDRILEVVLGGIAQKRMPLRQEFRIIRQDGTIAWVDALANFIDYQGKPAIQVAFLDITNRKRIEEALQNNENKYRLLADNVSDVIWKLDINTRQFTYISPSVQRLRGYTVEEAMSQSVAESVDPDSLAKIEADLPARLQRFHSGVDRSQVRTHVVKQPCKDGSWINVEIVTTLLTNEDGKVIEVLGVSRDITERKKVEDALRRSEQKFRSIVENSEDGISLVDENGNIIEWNSAQEHITGLKRDEVLGMPTWDVSFRLVPDERKAPEEYEKIKSFMQRLLDKGRIALRGWFEEQEILCPDKTHKNLHAVVFPIKTEKGFRIGTISRDFTEYKLIEDALRIKNAAIASSINAISISDPEGNFFYVNDSWLRMMGYEKEESLGLSFLEVSSDHKKADDIKKSLLAGGTWEGEFILKRKNDSKFDAHLSANMIRNKDDHPVCMVTSFIDVTERKEAERALQEREERFRKIFELSPIGIQIFDSDGFLVNANQVGQKIIALTGPTLSRGYNLFRDIVPDDETLAKLQSGKIANVGRWVRTKSAKAAKKDTDTPPDRNGCIYIDYLITSLGKACTPEGYLVLLQDITERKLADEALIGENERLQIIYDIWRTRVQTSNMRIKDEH